MINLKLVKRLKLPQTTILFICRLQNERKNLIFLIDKTTDLSLLKIIGNQFTEIEYDLQEAWGFPLDRSKHKFWNLPKCICPKLDNENACSGYFWWNPYCPLHGN